MIMGQKSMKVLIFGQIQQKNGHQSTILDPIHLTFCTLIHSMIVYKFPIHYVYKLWVTQIMKILISGQIQQRKMAAICVDNTLLCHFPYRFKRYLGFFEIW